MRTFTFKKVNKGYIELVKFILTDPCDYQVVSFPSSGKGKYINKRSRYHMRNVHVMFENPDEFTEYNVACPHRTKVMNEYMKKEAEYFDKGIIDSNKMGKISKIWKLIENPDETINANYGHMVYHLKDAGNEKFNGGKMMSQWEWCENRLINNPETLQAVMHFNRPKDQFEMNNDQPCTVFVQMNVISGKLNLHAYMRSNDIIYGMPYNLAYFILLQKRMCKNLQDKGISIDMGYLHYNSTSLHIYEDKMAIGSAIIRKQ